MTAPYRIDFYKTAHRVQYPKGTSKVYNGFTPRSGKLAPVLKEFWDEKVVWFGLQAFIKDYLIKEWNDTFFNVPKNLAVKSYKRIMDNTLGPDSVAVDHLEALHDLGYLPLCIKSLPEGSRVNLKVPTLTLTETLPKDFFWLPGYLETVLSSDLWKPSTTATIAYEYRRLLTKYAELTGAPLEFVPLQGHDFSARGMSGRHDAALSGMGHLLSFVGTDTVSAIVAAENFYNADVEKELVGCSIPASEHSTMTFAGPEGEYDTIKRLITEVHPDGLVSLVCDGFDFWKVVTEMLPLLKDVICARPRNSLGLSKLVIRPDSGNPVKIICGLKYKNIDQAFEDWRDDSKNPEFYYDVLEENGKFYKFETSASYHNGFESDLGITLLEEVPECEVKGTVECLWDSFGGTYTDKGYKVLNEHIGVIYGDSITLERAYEILKQLEAKGFASNNIVFGIGSFTYNYITRDSFGFTMKSTYGEVTYEDGTVKGFNIFKDPKTDNGTKKSACGLMRVEKDADGNYVLFDKQTWEQEAQGELKTVFLDGKLTSETSLSEIRNLLWGNV